MEEVGFFKKENRDKLPSVWNCSTAGDKVRVNACISVMDVTNIDSIGEKFDIKYRLFLIWKVNLEELGFPELAEKTLSSGNFYFMSSGEVDDFVSKYTVPIPTLFNKIQEEETEPAAIRCYGGTPHGTALVWNKLFSVTCRERFELQNFPFDIQDLTLDFRLNHPLIWDAFDLTVVSVQFFKSALVQTEWQAFGPVVQRGIPAHRDSKVFLKYSRLSMFYIQNIVLAMFAISILALPAFWMDISDIGSRMSTCLTLVLTVVAFKFITASSLPKVPYNTVIDYYINSSSASLIIVTYASVLPSIFLGDDGGETINRVLAWMSFALICFIFLAWFIYAYRVSHHWKLTQKVKTIGEDWYHFRFSTTPDFLDAEYSSHKHLNLNPAAV